MVLPPVERDAHYQLLPVIGIYDFLTLYGSPTHGACADHSIVGKHPGYVFGGGLDNYLCRFLRFNGAKSALHRSDIVRRGSAAKMVLILWRITSKMKTI